MQTRLGRGRRFGKACGFASWWRLGAVTCVLSLACYWHAPLARAQPNPQLRVPEQSVKAAYLYKFASYVDWPDGLFAEADSSIEIGVLGATALADELAEITTGRTVDNRSISVRRLEEGDSLDDIHILFVGSQEAERIGLLLAPARLRPILIVTESEGALAEGSMINFTLSEQRVRFEVSLGAVEQSRLRLNARLLAVAQRVYRAPG
jgi:hypothetical protein